MMMICSKMKALSVSSSSSFLMILLLLLFQISLAQRSFRQQSLGVEASSSSSSSPSAWKSRCNCCGRVVPTHTAFISKVGDTRGRRRVVTDCNTGSIGWAYKKTTTTTSSGSSSRNNKHQQQQQRLHRLHFTSNNNCNHNQPLSGRHPPPSLSWRSTVGQALHLQQLQEESSTKLYLRNNNSGIKKNGSDATSSGSTTAKGISLDYIDDCFGLIFLTGSVIVKDVPFAITFFTLSLLALVACRQGTIIPLVDDDTSNDNNNTKFGTFLNISTQNYRRRVPGIVAFLTILLTPIATVLLLSSTALSTATLPELEGTINPTNIGTNERLLELLVCSISIVYGFFTSDNPKD